MGGEWKQVIRQQLQKLLPSCVPTFQLNRVKVKNSRKKKSFFWHIKGKCSFTDCSVKYQCYVKKQPNNNRDVKLKVEITGNVCHNQGETRATRCDGAERMAMGKKANDKGPTEMFHEMLGEMEKESFLAGNLSTCKTPSVLKKAAHDYKEQERFHNDVLAEMLLLREHIIMEDNTSCSVLGYVQQINSLPFTAILYSEEQIRVHEHNVSLHLDATGTICKPIPGQEKRVLYHALVSSGDKGDPAVPLAEMLTNDQTATNITHFLMKVAADFYKVKNKVLQPEKVEIDFSWAYIHAVTIAFNKMDIMSYLQKAWNHVHANSSTAQLTVIHLCSAHVMHKFMQKVNTLFQDKGMCHFLGQILGCMVTCTELKSAVALFKRMCTLFCSETYTSEVNDAFLYLERNTRERNVNLDETLQCETDLDCNDEDEEDTQTGNSHNQSPLYSQSPFYTMFNNLKTEYQERECTNADKNNDQNMYFKPQLLNYILKGYMAYLPLWSGLMLQDINHDTNAPVENWMGAVKQYVLGGHKRLRPAEIVTSLRKSLKGRTRRRELSKRRKTKECHFEQAQERWDKRERKGRKKKVTYLNKNTHTENKRGTPSTTPDIDSEVNKKKNMQPKRKLKKDCHLLLPKNSKMEEVKGNPPSAEHETLCEDSVQGIGVTAIPWGGRYKDICLENTCTIDVGFQIMCALFLDHPDVKLELIALAKSDISVRTLLHCIDLIESGHIAEAKYEWLCHTGMFTVAEKNKKCLRWNAWGSEHANFVMKIIKGQENRCISTCNKEDCGNRRRVITSNDVLLR